MDQTRKIKIALEAKRKPTPVPTPKPELKRGMLKVGGKLRKEVNPFMKA